MFEPTESLLEKLSRRLRGYYTDSRNNCSLANAAGELASCVSAMTARLSGLAILEASLVMREERPQL